METYRRGRNETDSKSVCPKGHEGSNPSVSVPRKGLIYKHYKVYQILIQSLSKVFEDLKVDGGWEENIL